MLQLSLSVPGELGGDGVRDLSPFVPGKEKSRTGLTAAEPFPSYRPSVHHTGRSFDCSVPQSSWLDRGKAVLVTHPDPLPLQSQDH